MRILSILILTACSAAERPNILFLFSDDHALQTISAYGGRFKDIAPTPNIDRIAEQGAIFTRSYCGNSICGPSRASILTGKHSHINGFVDNNNSSFDGSQTTFPKLLQKAGYQTAIVGKWHLISDPQGFDYWEVLPGQGSYYNPDFKTAKGDAQYTGYVTDIITDRAIQWLEKGRDKDKPFVLMCQHKAPHRAWMPALRHARLFNDVTMPEPPTLFDDYKNRDESLKNQAMTIDKHFDWAHDLKIHARGQFCEYSSINGWECEFGRMTEVQRNVWDGAYGPENQMFIADMQAGRIKDKDVIRWKYQRYLKDYLRCIRALDENIGRMLDYLDQSGLAKNTIVMYSSDQGFYLGEHGWYDKRWMFEESLSMPFLMRWPGVVKPGTRSDAIIQNIDYAPTFLEVAGVDIPTTVQGRSLLPILKASGKAPADWRKGIYYYYSGESTHQVAAHDGVRSDRYKLMWFPGTKMWNLFDLEKDPHELKSVHDDPAYATALGEMRKMYDELKTQYRVNESTIPEKRGGKEKWWTERHGAKLKQVAEATKAGESFDLVFIGDSITQGWEESGKPVWDEFYGKRKALNLGFSGDRTEHVLWRLLNGELKDVDPKAYVLMIGTNNTGQRQAPAAETASGIKLTLELLRDRSPNAQILLLPVFPRGEKPDDKLRRLNDEVNAIIKDYAGSDDHIHWLDLTGTFLATDGTLSKDIMPDFLHPEAKGYRMWAEAMEPTLQDLLK